MPGKGSIVQSQYTSKIQQIKTVAELVAQVHCGLLGPDPQTVYVSSAFWIRQSTKFTSTSQKYCNHYLLLRLGQAFGACVFEPHQVNADIADTAPGESLATLLNDPRLPVQIAALDGYLGTFHPHSTAPHAQPLSLSAGTSIDRAYARDSIIVGMLDIQAGQRVALIGVVNLLVQAIRERGAECLPCDLKIPTTQWGDPVSRDMEAVLNVADVAIATGMTLGNGTFDRLLAYVRERAIPLIVYAQTGSAVVPWFLGQGVTAVVAEPFPFSQFSGDITTVYSYRDDFNEQSHPKY